MASSLDILGAANRRNTHFLCGNKTVIVQFFHFLQTCEEENFNNAAGSLCERRYLLCGRLQQHIGVLLDTQTQHFKAVRPHWQEKLLFLCLRSRM